MTGTLALRQVVQFLQRCFAWEYGNQSGQNLQSKSLRRRYFTALESVLTQPTGTPFVGARVRGKLAHTLSTAQRSSNCLYGAFILCAPANAGHGFGQRLCAPLFLGEVEIEDTVTATVALTRPAMLVNRSLLNTLFDDDVATSLARRLQALADGAPWGKLAVDQMVDLLRTATPSLTTTGISRFPLTLGENQVDHIAATATGITLVNASVVYVTRRSRQSMGVLHELSQMSDTGQFSRPLQQLVGHSTSRSKISGPLNSIGALSMPQRAAIEAGRAHTLSVVHGPPGTGKTHVLSMLACDQLAQGQSVLICARNDAAIDVIERFMRDTLKIGDVIVRGGSTARLRQLKKQLSQILKQGFISFAHPTRALTEACDENRPPTGWALASATRRAHKKIKRLDRDLAAQSAVIERRVQAAEGTPNLRYSAGHWWRSVTGQSLPLMDVSTRIAHWIDTLARRDRAVVESLQLSLQRQVINTLKKQRKQLAQLARSVTAREHNQRNLQESIDYRAVTTTLPLWLSTLADLSHIAPLQTELFDLVIIDEASQADTASALPALQRARRAVIIGDACQLRHVSFMPRATEQRLRDTAALPDANGPGFRDDSILDWANRQLESAAASSFLDEHFRSTPEIIEFSNRVFYADKLKLLTGSRPVRGAAALSLHRLRDGRRGKNGINRREAQAIVDQLAVLMDTLPSDAPTSIGVVSPFRVQAQAIERLIQRRFDQSTIDRHRLFVGTAHEWQGEERDVVLLSTAVDDESAAGSIVYLSRDDVLNVAITRARHRQIVFLSRSRKRLGSGSLFGRYIDWVATAAEHADLYTAPAVASEAAIAQLIAALADHPCRLQVGYQAGRVTVDILLTFEDRHLGLDLVGFDGKRAGAGLGQYELELLHRLNTSIIVVTRHDWERDQVAVVDYLNRCISELCERAS